LLYCPPLYFLQVIISFTLFFVCVPLVHFTNSQSRMGRWRNIFAARWFGIIVTLIIGGLNGYLIISSIKVRSAAWSVRVLVSTQSQPV
jgi:Mn2+/Fe2+ NRAMP family transporter